MHRRFFLSIIMFILVYMFPINLPGFSVVQSARMPNILQYLKAEADYQFGQILSFELLVESEQSISQATVTFKEVAGSTTGLVTTQITQQESNTYLLSAAVDLSKFPLRAFSEVQYRFDAYLDDGTTNQSPDFFFHYMDNRFEWQTIENNLLRVHWIGDDLSLGEKVLNTAQKGIERVSNILGVENFAPIDIYIYNLVEDLKPTLPAQTPDWSLGHAEPELNHILVALPGGPEQEFLIQQQVPHEIMHIMVSRIAGTSSVGDLPVWLVEGLATLAELYPNPDYAVVMENAREKNRLLTMQSLCTTFPQEPTTAILAHAQSASFVRYLFDRYQTEGIKDLIATYHSGVNCSDGIQISFGESIQQQENHWLSDTLGQSERVLATNNLTPWFVLLISIFIAPFVVILVTLKNKRKKKS